MMRQQCGLPMLGFLVLTALTMVAGCGQSLASQGEMPAPTSPASYFDGAVTLELVAPSEVRQGEWLAGLDILVTNYGEPRTFAHGGGGVRVFEAVDTDGRSIWRSSDATRDVLITTPVGNGETVALSTPRLSSPGSWDLRDMRGFPVRPGEYWVTGIAKLDGEDFRTSPERLVIHEAPLPDYAQAIRLDLTAPAEAVRGAPVSMDLSITNTGVEPLVLWWSGESVTPAPNYLDIVMFNNGERVRRASLAHGVEGQGHVILDAGETRSMSRLFRDAGDSRVWGGQHEMCCDNSFSPGAYTIIGMVNVSPIDILAQTPPFDPERATVVTAPHELVITP